MKPALGGSVLTGIRGNFRIAMVILITSVADELYGYSFYDKDKK